MSITAPVDATGRADGTASVGVSVTPRAASVPVSGATSPGVRLPAVELPGATVPLLPVPPVDVPAKPLPPLAAPPIAGPPVAPPPVVVPPIALPGISVPPVALPVVTLPAIALPPTTLPAVTLPAIALPPTTLPPIALPTVALPPTALPAIALPSLTVPPIVLPAVELPGLPPVTIEVTLPIRTPPAGTTSPIPWHPLLPENPDTAAPPSIVPDGSAPAGTITARDAAQPLPAAGPPAVASFGGVRTDSGDRLCAGDAAGTRTIKGTGRTARSKHGGAGAPAPAPVPVPAPGGGTHACGVFATAGPGGSGPSTWAVFAATWLTALRRVVAPTVPVAVLDGRRPADRPAPG